MPEDVFKIRRLFLSGAIIGVLLIAAQVWVRSAASSPAQDVPIQGQPPSAPLRLQATLSGDILVGTVSAVDKDGRPWTGTSGRAWLLGANEERLATVPLEPIGPGEFRLIAPLSQIGASGHLDVRLSGQGSSVERRALYHVDGDQRTLTYAQAAADPGSTVSTQSSGGPDAFGYTWDDAAAFEWADTSGGTSITLRDDEWSGPFPIGFTFNFYGQDYAQFYIDSNGYIGFDGGQTQSYYANTRLPSAGRPNGLIAPFWDDFDPSAGGVVRYEVFGSTPSRYLVVEWNAVPFYGLSDAQTFQVILHEGSNHIEFQYPDTRQGDYGDRSYGTVGIENEDGSIGLEYPYLIPITQTRAISITYNRPLYNVFITPERQGSSAPSGEAASFRLTVKNLGSLSDSFILSRSAYSGSDWPVDFYEDDGSTPLSGNSTGTIDPGNQKEIVASIEIPSGASAGDWTRATVQATSQGNPSEYSRVTLDGMVGTSFAQVYTDNESGDGTEDSENYYDPVQEGHHDTYRVTTDQDDSSYAAVATTPDNNAVNVWNTTYYNGTTLVSEVQYAVLNRSGGFVQPVVRLTDNSDALEMTFDFSPAVDVAPNGNIAIGWARQPGTYNIWYAIQSSSGSTVKSPTSLTNNTTDYPRDYPPSVAAMTGGRFLLAWERLASASGPLDVYYAVLNNDGSVNRHPTRLTDGAGFNGTPRVAGLPNGEAAIIWTTYTASGSELTYATTGSDGALTSGPAQITSNGDSGNVSYHADIAPLSDGQVAAAWTQAAGDNRQIQYTLLSGSPSPSEGIHGQVTYQGSAVSGINLALRYYNGSSWSTASTTTTQADGSYAFTDAATLGSGERYYVLYDNGDYGNSLDSSYLSFWRGFDIISYTAGDSVAGGDFDIANILLVSPSDQVTVTLPYTFEWQRRTATTSDSYDFYLFDYGDGDPSYFSGPLGYVSGYSLGSLPSGFSTGTEYGWMAWVHGPEGGYGGSYYYRFVTFSGEPTPSEGIHGQVTYQGSPVAGINLALRYYNGSSWSTADTTTTQADGSYAFTDATSLGSGETYYVRYDNGDYGNPSDSNYLAFWRSYDITSYTAGESVAGGDFDIANITLVSPSNGETVTLPQTFEWERRTATTSDSYEFHLFDPTDGDPWVYSGSLGYVSSFTLESLPTGFTTGTPYGWMVWASGPDDGYGGSYYYRSVTFSNTGATLGDGADEERSAAELGFIPEDEADTLAVPVATPTEPVGQASAAQTIHTVANVLSTDNVDVSLTTDDHDNLIMTWLDDRAARYLFYALADSSGTLQTPATIFQRTRRSYLWSSWNGYGNDSLTPSGYVMAVYLPSVLRNYSGQGPGPTPDPVLNGGFEAGDLSDWSFGGDASGLQPRVVTSPHWGGTYAAVLGQENAPCEPGQGGLVGRSWLYQDIRVPDTGSPQLSLYYRILTYDKMNADKFDRVEIYINGTLLTRLGDTGDYGCDAGVSDLGWRQFVHDLTPYRGQTVRLRLVNVTHPDDWFGTWTYVDEVGVTP
ncbi:MAG: hypothetical protein PVH50_06940 [Anaerolineae bacterium]|jgi:5-hydroxyisourate hydrolase-like protein (transthyretin family)